MPALPGVTVGQVTHKVAGDPLPALILIQSTTDNPMATATYQTNLTDRTYNGWTNYETWNVVLWIENDESIQDYIQEHEVCCYEELLEAFYEFGSTQTPDGVKWNDPKVNRPEINGDVFDF